MPSSAGLGMVKIVEKSNWSRFAVIAVLGFHRETTTLEAGENKMQNTSPVPPESPILIV